MAGRTQDATILKSDVVTSVDIAKRLGVAEQTVRQWRRRHKNFPQPFMHAARQGIWDFGEVKAWHEGRTSSRL